MNDNRDNFKNNQSGYSPNFVMVDTPSTDQEPEESSRAKSEGSSQSQAGQDYGRQQAAGNYNSRQTEPSGGLYRDPRENFTHSKVYNNGANSYNGAGYGNGSNPSAGADYGSGSNHNGYAGYGSGSNPSGNAGYNSGSNPSGNAGYNSGSGQNNGADPNFYRTSRPPKPPKPSRDKKPSEPIVLTKKSLALIIAGILVLSSLFGVGTSLITSSLAGGFSDNEGRNGSVDKSHNYTLEDATGSSMSIADIAENTKDSVVEIRTESVSSDIWMQQYVTEGAGSGVIITKDGYIMTNNHVIEGASKITVITTDEKQYEADVIGADQLNDVAVIKIKGDNFTAATYGNSDQLQVGDLAVAIGNPLGELGGSVTSGIISACDREIALDGKTMKLLQTDTSINPGNSGGGLFNDDAQLIGIVVAKSSGSEIDNIGFALPINTAAAIAEELMKNGHVSGQANTGMTYQETTNGLYIAQVNSEEAKSAGFQAGDKVLAVDGTEIDSFNTLKAIITSKKPGDKVEYVIIREGQIYEISLKLGEKTQ